MQKKEKVVAIRLTQSEYDTLEWARVNDVITTQEAVSLGKAPTMSQFISMILQGDIDTFNTIKRDKDRKAEAAAKRKATKEAKKAASDTK